jgi:nucleoside-diphosphate-sugar epimerase
MRTILIVGGYGTVGRKIARQLAQRGDMAVKMGTWTVRLSTTPFHHGAIG